MNRSPLVISAAITLLALTGCATTGGTLSDAASRLDRATDRFYDEVRSDSRTSGLERDAAELAEAAQDFNRDVKERAERDELRDRFERVASRYHELRDEFSDERPASSRDRSAFDDVTSAYLDLERELQYRRRVSER
jgi:hypothetical protein